MQLRAIGGSGAAIGPVPASPRARRRPGIPWAIATLCAVLAAAALVRGRRPETSVEAPIRFTIPPPAGASFFGETVENLVYALSPDGRELAFIGFGRESGQRVWVRRLSESEPKAVAGTEDARTVFWSPDGRSVGFAAGNQLRRVGLDGGAPVTICEVPGETGISATWGSAGDIVFAAVQGEAIYRVASAGGTAVKVLEPDHARGEGRVNWPCVSPGRPSVPLSVAQI